MRFFKSIAVGPFVGSLIRLLICWSDGPEGFAQVEKSEKRLKLHVNYIGRVMQSCHVAKTLSKLSKNMSKMAYI